MRPVLSIRPIRLLVTLVMMLALAMLSGPRLALAQSAVSDAAKQLSEKAREQYSIGNFREALSFYKQSYQASPLPVTIFNVAQCHRQLGQLEQALFLYKSYLRQSPQAPNRGTVENLIADLESQVEKRRAAGVATAPVDERSLLPQKDAATPRPTASSTSTDVDERPAWYRRWYVWAGLGAVVAGAVLGGVLGSRAATGPADPTTTHGTMTFRFGN